MDGSLTPPESEETYAAQLRERIDQSAPDDSWMLCIPVGDVRAIADALEAAAGLVEVIETGYWQSRAALEDALAALNRRAR